MWYLSKEITAKSMNQDWEKISEETVYQGYRNIIRKMFRLPNQQEWAFDIISVPSFATVAALTEDGEVILVEQYRPGPERMIVSFPEGRIDLGEAPEEAAKRELLEETGYYAQEIHLLKSIPTAYSNQLKHCYLALGCSLVKPQSLDETEFIKVFKVSISGLRALLRNPAENNFSSVDAGFLMLDFLERNHLC